MNHLANLIGNIEADLGKIELLPSFPFLKEGFTAAAFISGDDESFIDMKLYEALVEPCVAHGVGRFCAVSIEQEKNDRSSYCEQKNPSWAEFCEFQSSKYSHLGFYVFCDSLSWLGMYHYDGYFVLGGARSFIDAVCNKLYGHQDWKRELVKSFSSGNVFAEDFDELMAALARWP